mmetsp:Transcript_4662/g.10885  ORF Transcript_4662/g.10885 Transcript_4662/m.10885 type:complete len:229 (+) Transcript_4662:1662-2348(+)
MMSCIPSRGGQSSLHGWPRQRTTSLSCGWPGLASSSTLVERFATCVISTLPRMRGSTLRAWGQMQQQAVPLAALGQGLLLMRCHAQITPTSARARPGVTVSRPVPRKGFRQPWAENCARTCNPGIQSMTTRLVCATMGTTSMFRQCADRFAQSQHQLPQRLRLCLMGPALQVTPRAKPTAAAQSTQHRWEDQGLPFQSSGTSSTTQSMAKASTSSGRSTPELGGSSHS